MENAVYVNLSVVDLKPNVLSFLSDLAETAKESVFVTRVKDLAEQLGKDVRTIQRHLKELAEKDILQMRGRKGRAGGTVICFNSDLVQFTTSDKAFVNSEEPIDIDELLQTKIPKKKQEPNPNKRPRRTKSQMVEAQLLQDEKQAKIDELNGRLQMLGGVPNWEWFQLTDNPVGNYRTYLLTRLYNRYAALYIDRHNATALAKKEGKVVKPVSDDYDVLGMDKILGTSRWAQFEKFRLFCEENNIDPAAYLTAQFNRSTLTPKDDNPSKLLPFVNSLTSDASYQVYQGYFNFNERKDSMATFYGYLPHEFASDFVVQAICNAYDTADKEQGLFEYRGNIIELLKESPVQGEKECALADYYYELVDDMKKRGVSKEVQTTLKKYYITQALTQLGGTSALPTHTIIGSDTVQSILAKLTMDSANSQEARSLKELVLGKLILPAAPTEKQTEEGAALYYSMATLTETRQVLRLIQDRKGLLLPIGKVQEALKQYDKFMLPVDDYSMLDVDQIVSRAKRAEQAEEVNLEEATEKKKWVMHGAVAQSSELDNLLEGLQI